MSQPQSPKEMLASLNAKSKAAGLDPVVAVPDAPAPSPSPSPSPAPSPAPSPVQTSPAQEKPVETAEPAPAAPAADAFLDSLLGDTQPTAEPAPAKTDKEHNFAELRKQLKEREAEAKRISEEKAEREAELEQLRGELAKRDLTFDPKFEEKYVRPLAEQVARAKDMAKRFGADPAEVEKLLNMTGPDFAAAHDKSNMPSVLKQHILNTYLTVTDLVEQKQAALATAQQTQMQFAESRRQEQQHQFAQMTATRNQTFAQAVRNTVANDASGFFAVKEGVTTVEEAKATVLKLKAALDQAPGVPATQHFQNQVQLMYKGAAFDRVTAKLTETENRLAAVLAEAKRLNIPITISQGQVQPPPAAKAPDTGVKSPQQLMAELQAGKFSPGGELYKFPNH